MIIISDTTPIITLLKINQLDLLQKLFQEIYIPESVYDELTQNLKYISESEIIKNSIFIKKESINDHQAVSLLKRATGLDLGESEAIILSDEKKADLLIIDEVKGRMVAKSMGLKIMGTIGILMLAYEESLISKNDVIKSIDVMRNTGRHISESLYNQLLTKIGI